MISLLLLDNFYPVNIVPTSSKEKESGESLYTVRTLVMVRNQLPAQVVEAFNRAVFKNVIFSEKRFRSRL